MVTISAPKTLTLLRARAGNSVALPAMAVLLSAFILLFVIQTFIWPYTHRPLGWFEHFVWWMTLFWAGGVHIMCFGTIGLLLYRKNHANFTVSRIPQLVSFRIVSRGQNATALAETVQNVRETMEQHPLFDYRLEVVTDLDVPLEPGPDLTHFIVPDSYATSNGSLYKARALQYALDYSDLPEDAWIMHLDEESHISQTVVEACDALAGPFRARNHRSKRLDRGKNLRKLKRVSRSLGPTPLCSSMLTVVFAVGMLASLAAVRGALRAPLLPVLKADR